MLEKGSKSYSILKYKCPRCHEGDLFYTPTFSFKKTFEMPKSCNVCNQKYEIEPGFYWGAMYVSYALSGGYMLFGFALLFFLVGLNPIVSYAVITLLVIPLYPLFFRLSRSVWINLFVKYRPT
jgi:uncharacterized protein (DUF983 family)